jgi:nucleotide-binding universal stress UspA family protein
MNIVYATDGSEGSLAAARLLAQLPLTDEDRILVVTVASDQEGAIALDTSCAALEGTRALVQAQVKEGTPAEAILLTAAEEKADLIALGAMGHTGLVGYLLGSVAERVMRHANVPVLLARPVRGDFRQVLLAVDRSTVSESVAKAAAWLPLPTDAEVRLVTVIPPREALVAAAPTVWSGLAHELKEIMDSTLTAAEGHVRELGQMLQHTRRSVAAEVLRGEPASQILEAQERTGADLVIVGSHGEGGMDRWLLGSVSERIARHAQCSVLVVH